MTAFACVLNGLPGAGAAGMVYAADTEQEEQSWKKDVGAGEAIAQENILKILTVADLENFAQQCTLDQWSVGKHVVLEADLDLADSDFECIPTFGGTFDGNGHTISGFSMTRSGDVNGFFRYVQEGASVKNLNVSGSVVPDGHRDVTGGLAGNNKGTLSNCSFTGTVKGKNRAGGIAGINEAQGKIYNCSFAGDVTGEHYAGGIAGENLGSVVRCKNAGAVNTTEVKVSTEIREFGLEMLGRTDTVSNVPASTDVGGIAGASSGILQSCENAGDVGYPHTGYNVGGIAGRQSGYLDGCINSGTVNGRKDVGGIVGQFEPEVTLQFEPGMLEDLFTELEVLQRLIDATIQDAKGVSASVSGSMQGLSDSTKNVKTATQGLSDSMIGWADENLEVINDFSARLSWAIDQMVPAAEAMTDSLDSMQGAAGLLSDALKEGKDMMDSGGAALSGIADAVGEAGEAAEAICDALIRLGETIGEDEELMEMIKELIRKLIGQGRSFEKMGDLLEEAAKDGETDAAQAERLLRLSEAYRELGTAFEDLAGVLEGVSVENGGLTGADGLTAAADRVAEAGKELQIAGEAAVGGFEAQENGGSAQLPDAYAQVQRKMAELEKLLDETSALFDDWEIAKESGDTEDGAEAKKAAALEKLNLIQKKAQGVSDALKELEAAAGNGEADSSLTDAVKEAEQQLALIVERTGNLAERLERTAVGAEDAKDAADESGDKPDSEDGNGRAEEAEHTPGSESGDKSGSEDGDTPNSENGNKPDSEDGDTPGSEDSDKSSSENGNEPGSEDRDTSGSENEDKPGVQEGSEAEGSDEGRKDAGTSDKSGGSAEAGESREAETESGTAAEESAYYAKESVTETETETETDPADNDENNTSGSEGDGPDETESGDGSEEQPDLPEIPGGDAGEWEKLFALIQETWKEMEPEVDKLFDAMESIGDGIDSLAEAGSHGTAALGILSGASSKLKDSFRSMASASSVLSDTLSGLAGQPAVQFQPLDSRITAQKDVLDAALDDMTAQIDRLNSTMTVSSEVMLEDMEAINRQFGVIIRVLRQSNEKEPEAIEDHIVDISDAEETEEQASGCVTGSVNRGEICGDVNVAGIVGSMAVEYDFDPEDDLNRVGENSSDFSWLTSAVLSGCKNTGGITAKKDCVGGIVGRMDMGRVSGCESYGAVSSSGGSYVGGIAGASYAAIRESWAKCSLSGTDYVGGIAGLGTTITNCRSLVEISESDAFAGAIAGKLQEDGELSENTYVHETLAAVDGISYAGKAEPVAYDVLLSDSSVPEKFREFELTFTADGEVVSVVKFQYGKGIRSLPEIPAKEGYSAKWPDLDYSCLTFSRTVEAEYTAYESALSAGGKIPALLVDGSFSNEAVIEDETQNLTFTDKKGREHTGTAVTVRVKDPVLEEISYTVHYKLPEEGNRYRLWVQTQDGWEKREYETDGDYLLLKSAGEEVTFLLEPYRIPWDIMIVVALVAAAGLLLVVTFRKRKRRAL